MSAALILTIAFRNLLRRPRRSLILAAVMAGATALLYFGNALLDGMSAGLRQSFTDSLTGDVTIRAKTEQGLAGLFGDETPGIGEFAEIETLPDFAAVERIVSGEESVETSVPLLSLRALLESGSTREPVTMFGAEAEAYFRTLPGARRIVESLPGADGRLAFISRGRAKAFKKREGRELGLGEGIQFIAPSATSFRIRAAAVAGIVDYPTDNLTFDRVVIVDQVLARSLLGATRRVSDADAIDEAARTLLAADSLEALFDDPEEDAAPAAAQSAPSPDELLSSASVASPYTEGAFEDWHFIVARLKPGHEPRRAIRRLNEAFRAEGLAVEAIGWREAAGSTALFAYWLRIIFAIGMGIVTIAGSLVVLNALVGAILERKAEIGAMRALGAQRGFVRAVFGCEVACLALIGAVAGCAAGAFATAIVARQGIALGNPFLEQLFGSPALRPAQAASSVLRAALASLMIGAAAWIYPVSIALRVEPLDAMRSGT